MSRHTTVYSPYSSRLLFVSAENVSRLGEEEAKKMTLKKEKNFLEGLGKLCDSIHDMILLKSIEK